MVAHGQKYVCVSPKSRFVTKKGRVVAKVAYYFFTY